jgi:predicted RecB family nuclease
MTDLGGPLPLLTGYDARTCQRRVHNDHDATIEKVPWEPPADLQKRFDDGRAFEETVLTAMKSALAADQCRDLRPLRGKDAVIAATVAAMDEGITVILGGWLPDDLVGGRTGRPDVLLRVDATGYVPGDVKAHKTTRTAAKKVLSYSELARPDAVRSCPGRTAVTTDRIDDYLQLAHYWRMLEACGRAAESTPRGFIIGTDNLTDLDPTGFCLTWLELATPQFTTFSRTRGTARRTALERYDFEHGIRLEIARVAEQRCGAPADPEPLVKPIFSDECGTCPWHDYCLAVAGDAASAHIKSGRLDVREWRALDRLGISTVDELAALDVDDQDFLDAYLPEVSHKSDARGRLATAVRRARMVRDGVRLVRETTGAIPVPRADVEIDFDLEDAEGRVYLWGALATDGAGRESFEPTVSWDVLDETSERALARAFVDWLRRERDEAAARGKSLLAYHYTSHEIGHLKRILGEDEIADVLPLFVDLYAYVSAHYFGVAGHGLKEVAPAFGFHWRDESPSGLLSQLWYLDAIQSEDLALAAASRERLLTYNEDDVRATLAVRRGMARES